MQVLQIHNIIPYNPGAINKNVNSNGFHNSVSIDVNAPDNHRITDNFLCSGPLQININGKLPNAASTITSFNCHQSPRTHSSDDINGKTAKSINAFFANAV